MRSDEHSKGGASVSPDRDEDVKKAPIVVEIPVQNGPISGIVASPDGSRLMVTNYGGDSVSIIDTDSCRVVDTVSGVQEPFAIARGRAAEAAPTGSTSSSVSRAYDSIEVIDVSTSTVVATHPLALSVSDLAVSPDEGYVYASRNGTGGTDVAILDTTTGRIEVIDIAGPGTITQCVRNLQLPMPTTPSRTSASCWVPAWPRRWATRRGSAASLPCCCRSTRP